MEILPEDGVSLDQLFAVSPRSGRPGWRSWLGRRAAFRLSLPCARAGLYRVAAPL